MITQSFDADRHVEVAVETVQDLRTPDAKQLRSHFGVVMERTVNELDGMSCLGLEEVTLPKKQIMSSRSFGEMVTTIDGLREAISTYAVRAGEKLRSQHGVCNAVHVRIETNRFREQDAQYTSGITIPLTEATSDSVGWWLPRCTVCERFTAPVIYIRGRGLCSCTSRRRQFGSNYYSAKKIRS